MDDDLHVLTLPYNNDLYGVYNKTNNAKILIILILQIISTIVNWALTFVFPIKQQDLFTSHGQPETRNHLLNSYNLTIYSQLVLWLLFLLIRYYLKNVYYHRLRILGYNNHHDRIKKYILFPSFVLHKSNALLLLVTVIVNQLPTVHIMNYDLKPIHFVEMIVSVVSVIVITTISIHFYHEVKFRRTRNPPDVFCVDDPSRRLTSDGLNQVAIRSSSFLEDLLENQADLIYNLKLQNTHLRELLYKASQSNNNNEDGQQDNSTN